MGNSSSNGDSGPSYYAQAKEAYEQVICAIIRPPRCQYEVRQLGPHTFDFVGQKFKRTDLTLRNSRGMAIACSHWEPVVRSQAQLPCVIYLHGNASARLEALPLLSLVLSMGATLFSLDFCGSGHSEGDWVSLGAFEKDDLDAVVQHLRIPGQGTSTIALWGRSMGAATALMYAERDPSIAGMVLDSPFASLEQLAEELVEKGREQGVYAPSVLVSIALRFIRSSVLDRAKFDIRDLSPLKAAKSCFVPSLFVAASGDAFIAPHHSKCLHDACVSDGKNLILVDGDHNSKRPVFMFDSVSIFLQAYLQIREEAMLPDGMQFAASQEMPWKRPYAANKGFSLSSMLDIFSPKNRDESGKRLPTPADPPHVIALKNTANARGEARAQQQQHQQQHNDWSGGDHDNDDCENGEDEDEYQAFRDSDFQPAAAAASAPKPPPGQQNNKLSAQAVQPPVAPTRAPSDSVVVDTSADIGTGMDTEKQKAVQNTVSSVFKAFGFGGKAKAPALDVPKSTTTATSSAAVAAARPADADTDEGAAASLPAPKASKSKAPKAPSSSSSSSSSSAARVQDEVWSCPSCTLFNGRENSFCVACETRRPAE